MNKKKHIALLAILNPYLSILAAHKTVIIGQENCSYTHELRLLIPGAEVAQFGSHGRSRHTTRLVQSAEYLIQPARPIRHLQGVTATRIKSKGKATASFVRAIRDHFEGMKSEADR